ncbi:MAG TPA: FtsX-like permease family protein [Nocardioides sp.]|uniref:ABC transporter permease n=1 Tax=Nocardioides sp. TaxID=35761 RepID=UPI002D0E7987|nr:FtsX-like permease family protein [Nocardioides sp.]HTW13880.1 FtsX-like permease family protein [Nocardioides sp.]
MLRVSWRNLLAAKLRLLLTVTAATLGVAFVCGTFVLSDTMVKAFDELYGGLTSGTDVVVHAASAYDADVTTTGGQPRPLDDQVVDTVAAVPGVRAAEGAVSGYALILDPAGEPIQPGGAPTFATTIHATREMSGAARIRDGRPPEGPEEMVIDARTVDSAGFRLGDDVEVIFESGRRSFTLVGVVGFGENDSILGATLAGFDLATSQRVLDRVGLVDEVDVLAEPGVSVDELRDRVDAAVPAGVEVVTGEQVASDGTAAVEDALGIFTTVLLVFAGVAVLVGSFVIWNTFNVLVAQRRRQVALLRAVGATRRQVLAGVLIEASAIGALAGALGIAGGVGLAVGIRQLLTLIGVEIPTTTPAVETRTVLAGLGVGLGVTVVAALLPAWSAARVAPMEALRVAAPVRQASARARHLAGALVLAAGAAGMAACAIVADEPRWSLLATGTAFLGLVFVGPLLARAVGRLASHGRTGGGWRLAGGYLVRSSRRAAATALALTIGLAVVAAVSVTAASLKDSVTEAVSGGNRSDLILAPAGAGLGISPAIADLVRTRPEVADVVEVRRSVAQVDKQEEFVDGVDSAALDRVLDLGLAEGNARDLAPGRILVGSDEADDQGIAVGDVITLTFPETGARTFEVAGTFDKGSLINTAYVLAMADFEANVTARLDTSILLTAAPGVTPEKIQTAIEEALVEYPNVNVNTPAEQTAQARESIDQLLGIVTALLLLAVVIAVLGIVNTLALSVVERTRELGLLRAVGGTQGQVRSLIRHESVLMSLLGAVCGLIFGTAAGVALSRAFVDEGITSVTIPAQQLLIYLGVALGVGVLAAIGPARRASRVDVLQALSAD